ncbi:ATP-dependent DNA helicase [Paenibacillus sp. JX-17]|uniref:ATP-dependent DNA helicase n=1 Tax=Paenibacillus lacisoli TaxID=3064525 RepID=A0ABT9C9G9_9BACL|nr:ATP-dependent DNA helicase [Paenibacillus sp. JX-17]MDO7905228.1 ATP-dependent DNA helicase [Paenibacillus sp. JX-17]
MAVNQYPFEYNHKEPFIQQVSDWVADVFYDILPEAGFEVRDEQIFMAFQLERAFAEKKTIFAEAGVGTGKTLVYLLYAVCYARYTRKPAIIACADESLIEQLVKPEGDIAKLAQHLGLVIDARLGKSQDQYLCLNKLADIRFKDEDAPLFEEVNDGLPDFVHFTDTMQSFHPYGDRKQYPHLNDAQWSKINWDHFQDCFVCDRRHRCGLTLSRDHYRKSADLIICSHDYYMEHVWTYEGRKREGQLPLLPEHSSVVFDEGHLLEEAAQNALSYKLKHAVFEELITRLLQGEVRESLALRIEDAIMQSEGMFQLLEDRTHEIPGSERKAIVMDEKLLDSIRRFSSILDAVEEELVFESELYTLDAYQLRIVEEHLEMIQKALALFRQSQSFICWAEHGADGLTLSVMPQTVKEVLAERVFSARMPIVFSSATLSVESSFQYVADSLGVEDYLSFSVASPYDYAEKMKMIAYGRGSELSFAGKTAAAVDLIAQNGGSTLVLFRTMQELREFKQNVAGDAQLQARLEGIPFLYEGDREISDLIQSFQGDAKSVLCAVNLWEGLDVPGLSLSRVLIWSLPYPPQDPVYAAKRKAAQDAFADIDLPYMLLRLRQGIGRLIRTRSDAGLVAILDGQLFSQEGVLEHVLKVLPEGVELGEPEAV